jgi:hypothetical protein
MTASARPPGSRFRRFLVETYATLDERSLGLGRIVLALALLVDLAKRVPGLRTWYSNEGLLPNHTLLWSPPYDHTFSLFFMASHWFEAALGFAVCALAYFFLLVGYKTKLAQVASFVAVICLHGRVVFLQIGGDVALSELSFWTLFLPLGRRFSVDALLEQLRFLERGQAVPERARGVRAFACFALLFQLAGVYLLNAVQKSGPMWLDGSLLHYVLHIDPIVTRFGYELRGVLTPGLSAFLTHSARYGEALVPLALLVPVGVKYARALAVATIIGLHVGFAVLLNVGLFSLAMIAYTPNFLPTAYWESWGKRRSRKSRKAALQHDTGEAFADAVRRVASEPSMLMETLPKLPLGNWLTEFASLPYAERLFVRLARAAVERARRDNERREKGAERQPLRYSIWLLRLRTCAIAVALYVCIAQAGKENPVVPPSFRLPQPAWGHALVHYLQLYQGWHMFAPEALRGDMALSVDAVTKDGRHVDPFNEFARPGRRPPVDTVPPRLGNDVYVNSYFGRIAEAPQYHRALAEWILRFHERTGHPEDEIVSFSVALVTDQSPPPGEHEPRHPRRNVFLTHPPK